MIKRFKISNEAMKSVMAEQTTSSNVNITDAVLNQSPVIKDAENVTINYTQPPSTSSSDEDGWDAVGTIMKEHNSRLGKEGDFQFQGVSTKIEIPPVHPAISEITFFEKDKASADEEYDPDDDKELYSNKIITQVQFQDLLKLISKSKFISIIGRAGSGKPS
ncbi:unnamed protein product [Clavelina lepadiformis]|uniref:Uncharacterized protein n=1 Tax=Clavelina lepadiformis TaxID=159417 RepID=A0ABP0FSP3_CLALP